MHAKYQVAIFNIAKVMDNVKVFGRPDDADGRRAGYDNTSGFLRKTTELKMTISTTSRSFYLITITGH